MICKRGVDIERLPCVETDAEFDALPFRQISSFHWESDHPYRPFAYFKTAKRFNSLFVRLKCYEESPRAVYSDRDDPVYEDSCLEFFCAPVFGDERYINIECNSNGVFLSEIGEGKYDRKYIKTLTSLSPDVSAFDGKDENGIFWGVDIVLSADFVSALFGTDKENIDFSRIRANFYKCGDKCPIPHYAAFSPVRTIPPGFHDPECFETFIL